MKMTREKLVAIMLIGAAQEHKEYIEAYFDNVATREEILSILEIYKEASQFYTLAAAAIFCGKLNFDEILKALESIAYAYNVCEKLIESDLLTGSQIVTILERRFAATTASAIPLLQKAVESRQFTNDEIITLLEKFPDFQDEQLLRIAKPRIEKYIKYGT